jgi:hypothetical protein
MASTHYQDAATGSKNVENLIDVERQGTPILQEIIRPNSLGAGACHPFLLKTSYR